MNWTIKLMSIFTRRTKNVAWKQLILNENFQRFATNRNCIFIQTPGWKYYGHKKTAREAVYFCWDKWTNIGILPLLVAIFKPRYFWAQKNHRKAVYFLRGEFTHLTSLTPWHSNVKEKNTSVLRVKKEQNISNSLNIQVVASNAASGACAWPGCRLV